MKRDFAYMYILLTVFFLIAMADLGYWYYSLMRLVSCGVFIYSSVKIKEEWLRWIFGGLAVLYNPVFPIHLNDKEIWGVINLITIIFIWTALRIEAKTRKEDNI